MLYSIYLGSRCNLNCKYCHREILKPENGITQNLINVLNQDKNNNLEIRFIGGEPTIYFDEIEYIVSKFPEAHFSITTNGYNCTDYMIKFLKDHNFSVRISYDGEKSLRDNLPNWEIFKKYDYKKILLTTTLTHENCDLSKIEQDIANISMMFGYNMFTIPHPMHNTNNINEKYKLTKEDYISLSSQIINRLDLYFNLLQNKILNNNFSINNFHFRFDILKKYYAWCRHRTENPYSIGENYCVNKNHRRIDFDGEQFSCSYIRDYHLNIGTDITEHTIFIPQKCKTCSVYDLCGSGCTKTKDRDLECLYYKAIFSYFKKRYGPYKFIIDSIKPFQYLRK